MINGLIDDLGRGLNDSTIRSRLLSLREQAEAVDLDLQRARADLKRLKKYAKAEKIISKQDSVEEVGKQLMRILAQFPYLPSVGDMAEALGIQKVEAQYHVDRLLAKDLIERFRGSIRLTPKGTAYVVENKLA
jgi:DNA-binding MarR family transcriptional regulator